jgi:hypothetical protein
MDWACDNARGSSCPRVSCRRGHVAALEARGMREALAFDRERSRRAAIYLMTDLTRRNTCVVRHTYQIEEQHTTSTCACLMQTEWIACARRNVEKCKRYGPVFRWATAINSFDIRSTAASA